MEALNFAQSFAAAGMATVTQLPFHLLLATPWIVASLALAIFLKRRVGDRSRLVACSGLAAAGIAPAYGAHFSMVPMYLLVISGDASLAHALLSLTLTWLFLAQLVILVKKWRKRPA